MRKEIVISITKYTLDNAAKNISDIDIYNGWSAAKNIIISDTNDAKWLVEHIKNIKKNNASYIKEALLIDESYIS